MPSDRPLSNTPKRARVTSRGPSKRAAIQRLDALQREHAQQHRTTLEAVTRHHLDLLQRAAQTMGDITGLRGAVIVEDVVAEQESPSLALAPAGLGCTEVALRAVLASGIAMAGLRDGKVFITREDPVFADALRRAMVSHGIMVEVVDEVPEQAGAVICLAALGPAGSQEQCVDMHVHAFRAARAVAKSSSQLRLFVTVQSTGGRFGAAGAPIGVASLVKTASGEWPNASVRAIDMESLDAERLTTELLAGGSGIEIALAADGTRLVVDDVEASPTGETISVSRGGVVVVTDGARGATAESVLALAVRHGFRLALLGRTPLQDSGEREVRATLATAQGQGTPARYFRVDVNDRAGLDRVLDDVRQRLGPIVGVVHDAGVRVDTPLSDLDEDQFVEVFSTKVVAAEALLDATSADDLRFISLFSSMAARVGTAGQAADATANAVLESIAGREAARRGDACVVRAFDWGALDGGQRAAFFAEHALRRSSAAAVVVAVPAQPRLRPTRLEWDVSADSLPVLTDHQVRGRVVVPVVIVLDVMLRAARGLVAQVCSVVRDFQVLSGITLAAPEQKTLAIDVEPVGASYTVTIRDREGRQRYRAIVDTDGDPSSSVVVPAIAGAPWPMSVDEAYAGPLFHGPSFAAIEHLDTFGAAGGTASLRGKGNLGWPGVGWAIDAASLDGGLQLGLLWASTQGRSLMLPQRIGRVVLSQSFPENAALRCRLAAYPVNDKRVEFDVTFETADGALVAALENVEFYTVVAASHSH